MKMKMKMKMKIIVDAMGGDNAPNEIVKGALEAVEMFGEKISLVLVGDKSSIGEVGGNIEIVHTNVRIDMTDVPTSVVKSKADSSMGIGLKLLRDGGDAFISAGNTGALHAGSSVIVKRIEGVQRSCIATILPFSRPILMMDAGANPVVTPEYLEQWALMGSIYMNKMYGVSKPEVGLLNNGTEENKGTAVMIEAYGRIKNSGVSFVGNVESRDIPFGACDVLVTDGFTGNIVLKLIEGMGKFMFGSLKDMYGKNTLTKISYLAMKKSLKSLKNGFDASEHGGAPLLGLSKPVIKAHGSSDAKAFRNAIRQAISYAESNMIQTITEHISP